MRIGNIEDKRETGREHRGEGVKIKIGRMKEKTERKEEG